MAARARCLCTTHDEGCFTITAPNLARLVGRAAADGADEAPPAIQTDARVLRNPTDDEGKVMPVVFTESAPTRVMDHVVFMALTPAGAPPATTRSIAVDGGNAIGITWDGVEDVFVRRSVGASKVNGDVATDGRVAKLTVDGGETVMRAGTRLRAFGRDYITVTGSPATVTVSDDEVQAFGEAANVYRVYAPERVTHVYVNGAGVSACRDGAAIEFPCAVSSGPSERGNVA